MRKMNPMYRAMLFVWRKKGKTASLFLTIFVIAVFLVSCFGVLHASKRLSKDIRTSLGAAFYIRANTTVSTNENGQTEVTENEVHMTQKEIDEVMRTGEIKYCNPINYGFAKSDAIEFIPGEKHTKESSMGKVTALRFSALAPDFAEEAAVLTRGTHITDADTGKILLSEPLADANHLSVGDVLMLTHAELGKEDGAYTDEIPVKTAYAKVEVSGIYQWNTKSGSEKPTATLAENEIYASLDILNELGESERGIYTGEVGFYITDPEKLSGITHSVRQLQSIDWTTHFIRTNDFQYRKIADRLASLGDLVKILLVLASVFSAAFLTLLFLLRMRGRMQEAGILLAAGIPKGQIAAGFLLEALSVTIFALLVSYFVSYGAADVWGRRLFDGLQPHLIDGKTLSAGGTGGVPIENYLKLSVTETLLLYLCQMLVVTASSLVSSILILRLKPKEILSRMS